MTSENLTAVRKDTTLRAEQVFHLGTQCFQDDIPDGVSEAFEYNWDEVWKAIGCPEPHDNEPEAIIEHLWRYASTGFLVRFATPSPTSFISSGYATLGWGRYTSGWVYAETMEEACKMGLAWKKVYIQEERERLEVKDKDVA